MKIFGKLCFISLLLSLVYSCKDDNGITLDLKVNLGGNTNDLVLNFLDSDALALSLYWQEGGSSNVNNLEQNLKTVIQFSTSESFDKVYDVNIETGVYNHQFTVGELEAITVELGMQSNVSAPLFIRIKSSYNNDSKFFYSDILKVNVTPWDKDPQKGYILTKEMALSDVQLYSSKNDGVFSGFIYATSYYNFYFRDGSGNVWGNYPETGKDFTITNKSDRWNLWFPEPTGCYYAQINENTKSWNATYIPELDISGELSGSMSYNSQSNQWTYTFLPTKTGNYNIKLSGSGKNYNEETGSSSASGKDVNVYFVASSDGLKFSNIEGNIQFTVDKIATTTLILDLNDPKSIKLSVNQENGSTEPPVTIQKYLYVSGVDDAVSGEWTFDNYLRLYNEKNNTFAGVANVDSKWGYRLYPEKNNWDLFYGTIESGTSLSGTLLAGSTTNIPAHLKGLYLIEADMNNLKYSLSKINSVGISGVNGDWSTIKEISPSADGTYVIIIDIRKQTDIGIKIYLNNNLNLWFGGNDGILYYNYPGIIGSNNLESGTYTLTINLIKGTYSITK